MLIKDPKVTFIPGTSGQAGQSASHECPPPAPPHSPPPNPPNNSGNGPPDPFTACVIACLVQGVGLAGFDYSIDEKQNVCNFLCMAIGA